MTTAAMLAKPGVEPEAGPANPLQYLSASRLKTFQECRLKFCFKYVERIPTKVSAALFVGQLTHRVLQQWNLNRWRGQAAGAEALRLAFDRHWSQEQPQGLDWEGQEEKSREKTWTMIEFYLAQTPIPLTEKPQAVEVTVERDLDAHGLPPLKGVIDLVRQGGVIVDFKTTARTPEPLLTVHQHELQLGCYALLYREATGTPESGFELHHLVKTKEPKLVVTPMAPVSKQQMQRLVRVMESYVRGVEAGDYVPSPGQHCAWCDYLKECRAWKAGGAF